MRVSTCTDFTAQYWRELADKARTQAAQMNDADARRTMLDVAKSCDFLAGRTQAMAMGKPVRKGKT